jgi:signal transduction histidine kinase
MTGRLTDERAELKAALEAAARRNRELERLRQLAAAMLAGRGRDDLARDVAQAAADLLEAQAASVAFLVEEGRFLRVAASVGALEPTVGMLIPVDGSLVGSVVTEDAPALSDSVDDDPRSWKAPVLPVPLGTAAIVPLRTAGVVIGVVSVYNRQDGRPFDAADVELLETLGDQVVVGLERALMLDESRRNEHRLATANLELQRATRLKSEFLANMSHELRTPLNAIIGFSDLLLQNDLGPLAPIQRDFLESILRNGRHLLGLINSVLDLAKIEAGRMTLDLVTTDVRQAITGAVTDTAALRTGKRQGCTLNLDDAPLTIVADPTRVRQVLYNLLSNASKFTPEGGELTLTAICTRAPLPVPAERSGEQPKLETRAAVWVSVIDTGIGIEPDDMPKLFEEFSQVESGPDRPQQGTGLGLALCRKFIEMHGGAIGAESIPGRGSTFWFILPVEGPVRRS